MLHKVLRGFLVKLHKTRKSAQGARPCAGRGLRRRLLCALDEQCDFSVVFSVAPIIRKYLGYCHCVNTRKSTAFMQPMTVARSADKVEITITQAASNDLNTLWSFLY
jgi:hypothetical protein